MRIKEGKRMKTQGKRTDLTSTIRMVEVKQSPTRAGECPKQKTPPIIQLMGKENKRQAKKTHRAILETFRGDGVR
jgi:hypothetical protein